MTEATPPSGLDQLELQVREGDWQTPVPDELQSDIRMRFNEALAGGPNMNGDGGPTLSRNHALDCVWATQRIEQIEADRRSLVEALELSERGFLKHEQFWRASAKLTPEIATANAANAANFAAHVRATLTRVRGDKMMTGRVGKPTGLGGEAGEVVALREALTDDQGEQ